MLRRPILLLLALLGLGLAWPVLADHPDMPQVKPRGLEPRSKRVAVLFSEAESHGRDIFDGVADGLRGTGYEVLSASLPGRPKSSSWRQVTDALVRLSQHERVGFFIVGPERDLSHLALQFSVKAGVQAILVACPDPQGVALPLPNAHHVFVEGSRKTREAWRRAGRQAAAIVRELGNR
jgi:hypothetical protein